MRHEGCGEPSINSLGPELDTLGAGQVPAQTDDPRGGRRVRGVLLCRNVKTGQAIDFEFQVRNYFSNDKNWQNMTS